MAPHVDARLMMELFWNKFARCRKREEGCAMVPRAALAPPCAALEAGRAPEQVVLLQEEGRVELAGSLQ